MNCSTPLFYNKDIIAISTYLNKIFKINIEKKCVVEENDHEFLWRIQECLYCFGRTSNTPICYMVGGFLDGLVTWATGNKHVIEERKCKARGDQVCEFSIKKESVELTA